MTFRELKFACSSLSQHLVTLGIQPGLLVPLCFERSKWSVIAMIAVLQLGAACVCLDPAHPKARIRDILDRTNAKYIITSPLKQHIMADTDATVVTIPVSDAKATVGEFSAPRVTPHDTAFIIFTSGSTGMPKGILMEHANLATSIRHYSSMMRINQETRSSFC